jgi:hypothetical protein
MHEIIIGRQKKDLEKHGKDGAIFLGRHYVQMGPHTSLSSDIYLDLIRSHVIFVCGKRGGGKSYTMGVMSEGMASLPPAIKKNLSILLIDTMGVFWTMKYPNRKERVMLNDWNQKPEGLDVKIFTPIGFYETAKEKGIPTDYPFALAPNLLSPEDWLEAFSIDQNSKLGVLIQNALFSLGNKFFSIQDVIKSLGKLNEPEALTAIARFQNAEHWGVFAKNEKEATPLEQLAAGGQVGILDISAYATTSGSWNIKTLVTGIVCKHLFTRRMTQRKQEEFDEVKKETSFLSDREFDIFAEQKQDHPLLWIGIDEAHEFLPREGKVHSSDPLITILREGRQPGISLILASQQPGKIHTDVMTQSDIVISHRLTAKIDIDALGLLMQSYMRQGLDVAIDSLPRESGAALIFDDTNEKMFQVRIRPRFTWHGGESPKAIREKSLK